MFIDPHDLIAPSHYGTRGVPHDVWTRLREGSPVHRCEFGGDFEDFWAITRHADIVDVSGKPQLFSNRAGPMILSRLQQAQVAKRASGPMGKMLTIIEMDPPEHRVVRKVASGFFTPRSIRRLDEIVTESARTLVDSLGEEGECDFVEKVSQRHPLRVLATLLGIDREDEERLLELTQQLFAGDDPDLQRKGEDREKAQLELGMELYQMFDRIIQDRRARPREDLATLLATAKLEDGAPLGPIETFGYYLIVFTAGHDTTRNALSSGFAAMIENPDQLELLKEVGYGLEAEVDEDGRLAKLAPDRDHLVSAGLACHKGLLAREIHHDPDRLNHPQRRRGGGFERWAIPPPSTPSARWRPACSAPPSASSGSPTQAGLGEQVRGRRDPLRLGRAQTEARKTGSEEEGQ